MGVLQNSQHVYKDLGQHGRDAIEGLLPKTRTREHARLVHRESYT